ncbi:MAG: RNA polymerase sigma factor [Fimbriimonadaceae bacterium]|nr:RNA polymerase sigma factor [Fimbriimonadaceae bacterium]
MMESPTGSPHATEEVLDEVRRAKRGQRDALSELVRRYYADVYRFCGRRVPRDLASDVAQETFVTVQQTIKRYDERASFRGWLFGIAHNHCRNAIRKTGREIPVESLWERPGGDAEGAIVNREALRGALLGLTSEHREVVVLHEIEQLTYDEIATMLGVPVGTVKSRLHHAFLNLRKTIVGGEQ